MTQPQIELPKEEIEAFCRRWNIEELSLFGSVVRDDFDPQKSDIDFLVSFKPTETITLLKMVEMQEELAKIVGRDIDLVTRWSVENSRNWVRKKNILSEIQQYYVAS